MSGITPSHLSQLGFFYLLRKREELSNTTGDGDIDDDGARVTDAETNRFFFFPWGFVAGSSSVRILSLLRENYH